MSNNIEGGSAMSANVQITAPDLGTDIFLPAPVIAQPHFFHAHQRQANVPIGAGRWYHFAPHANQMARVLVSPNQAWQYFYQNVPAAVTVTDPDEVRQPAILTPTMITFSHSV